MERESVVEEMSAMLIISAEALQGFLIGFVVGELLVGWWAFRAGAMEKMMEWLEEHGKFKV